MKISALLTKTLAFSVYRFLSSFLADIEAAEGPGNDDKKTMATQRRIKKTF